MAVRDKVAYMNFSRALRTCFIVALAVCCTFGVISMLHAQQSSDIVALRNQLSAHYDIVALQDGLGLVPHQRNTGIRLIEIRNGAIAVNGDVLTAREARERLG